LYGGFLETQSKPKPLPQPTNLKKSTPQNPQILTVQSTPSFAQTNQNTTVDETNQSTHPKPPTVTTDKRNDEIKEKPETKRTMRKQLAQEYIKQNRRSKAPKSKYVIDSSILS
jgi:hypothetical protein